MTNCLISRELWRCPEPNPWLWVQMSNRTRLSAQSQDWDMHSAPVGWVLPQALSAGTSKLFPLPRLLTQTWWLQQWMLSTSYTPQESGGRCQNSSALAWWINCSLAAGVPYIATRTVSASSLSSRNLVCILQDKSLIWDAVSRHKNAILVQTKMPHMVISWMWHNDILDLYDFLHFLSAKYAKIFRLHKYEYFS